MTEIVRADLEPNLINNLAPDLASPVVLLLRHRALRNRALRLIHNGRFKEGEAIARELIDLAKDHEDLTSEALGLSLLGESCWYQGDLEDAATYLQKAGELLERLGEKYELSNTWRMLGWVAFAQGFLEQAKTCAHESLGLLSTRETAGRDYGLVLLARIEHARGEPKRALALLRKGCEIFRGDWARGAFWSLNSTSIIILADHDPLSTALLYGAFIAQCNVMSMAIPATEKPHLEAVEETLRSQLGDEAFQQAIQEGAQIPPDQLIPLALDMLNGLDPHAISDSAMEQ